MLDGRAATDVTVPDGPSTPDDARPRPRLVAIDWGTTARRAWLLCSADTAAATRRESGTLLASDHGGTARTAVFENAFSELCGEWLRADPTLPVIACGMVGSAHGWADAGYLDVPWDLRVRRSQMRRVEHDLGPVHLVPGLRAPTRPGSAGDLIRGEETQLVGVLERHGAGAREATVLLPGTHTKWIEVRDGQVVGFTTAMSGELYGLLRGTGTLALAAGAERRDDAAFGLGLRVASTSERGLAVELFGARVRALTGRLDASAVPDYLSGLIIGDEVRHRLPVLEADRSLLVCGSDDLCRRYAAALDHHGVPSTIIGEDATAAGLWSIAGQIGLVGPLAEGVRNVDRGAT